MDELQNRLGIKLKDPERLSQQYHHLLHDVVRTPSGEHTVSIESAVLDHLMIEYNPLISGFMSSVLLNRRVVTQSSNDQVPRSSQQITKHPPSKS